MQKTGRFSGTRRLDTPDDQVRVEIETALHRGLLVVPVLIDGAVVPSAHELPTSISELAHRNGVQVRHDPDFHSDLVRLIAGLRAARET